VHAAGAGPQRLGAHAVISAPEVPGEAKPDYVPRDAGAAGFGVWARVAGRTMHLDGSGPAAGAPGWLPRAAGNGIPRRIPLRPVIIAAAAGIAVVGLLIAASIPSGSSRAPGPSGGISGPPAWTYETGGPVHCNLLIAGRTVYVGSDDHKVYALDAANGHIRWTRTTGGSVVSSPAVAGGTVYVGSSDDKVYALNTTNGQVR
jgi:PQQ-like domain